MGWKEEGGGGACEGVQRSRPPTLGAVLRGKMSSPVAHEWYKNSPRDSSKNSIKSNRIIRYSLSNVSADLFRLVIPPLSAYVYSVLQIYAALTPEKFYLFNLFVHTAVFCLCFLQLFLSIFVCRKLCTRTPARRNSPSLYNKLRERFGAIFNKDRRRVPKIFQGLGLLPRPRPRPQHHPEITSSSCRLNRKREGDGTLVFMRSSFWKKPPLQPILRPCSFRWNVGFRSICESKSAKMRILITVRLKTIRSVDVIFY